MTIAYDYNHQRWLDSVDGDSEASRQISETLKLLRGPKGKDYARFVGRAHAEMLAEFERGERA